MPTAAPPPRSYGGQSREERASRRRRSFLDAALEVFGTVGYRAATVRLLCREAGVTDRYFYEEFTSTEDLLVAVYEECTARLLDAVAGAAAASGLDAGIDVLARAALEALLGTTEDDPRLARVVWFEVLGVSDRVERCYLGWMSEFARFVLQLLPEDDRLVDAASLSTMSDAAVGAISHVTMTWVADGLTTPRADVVEALTTFLSAASRGMLRA